VRLHRVLKTTPEKLYKAFITPDAMVKFFPPYGFTGHITNAGAVDQAYHGDIQAVVNP
jgi:uncharacterized protein YndB with AHSA1/START domain